MGGNTTILLWVLLVCMWWLALLQPSCNHEGRYCWPPKDGKVERWKQSGSLKTSLSCWIYWLWALIHLQICCGRNNTLIVHAAFKWFFFQLISCGSLSPRIWGTPLQGYCTYSLAQAWIYDLLWLKKCERHDGSLLGRSFKGHHVVCHAPSLCPFDPGKHAEMETRPT